VRRRDIPHRGVVVAIHQLRQHCRHRPGVQEAVTSRKLTLECSPRQPLRFRAQQLPTFGPRSHSRASWGMLEPRNTMAYPL